MLVIKDFATTILASALTAAATSVVVSDASRLPALSAGDYYYLVLQKFTDRTNVEVVKVTGAAGNTLTVVRAQAGTTAKSFAIGDYAEQRVTVGTFSEYIAQSVAGKVDKSDGYVEQSLGLLNTGDSVKAAVGISYDATNGHGTILSGGDGANKVTPYVALRPLGVADSSVQLKYAQDGSLILSGGSRYVETGLLSVKHPTDANGWPNAINSDANNYNNRARGKVHVNNNALYFIADAAFNARRFGIQSGHEDPGHATAYGVLDLNPFGGSVRVNGGLVYHTNYVPTPAAVGALSLSGGIMIGNIQSGATYRTSINQSLGFIMQRPGSSQPVGLGQGSEGHAVVGYGPENALLAYLKVGVNALFADLGNGIKNIYHEDYLPTPAIIGAVPTSRTVNGKPLTADITLSAADVGAVQQGDRFVANNAVGNDFYQCAIEVNGNTAIDSRPGIGFHMAGRFASTLHLWEGGDFRFHTQGLTSYAGIMTGNVNANDVYIRSDRRLKKNLVEVRDALRKVSALTAYSYDKKQTLEATEYDKKEVGLIAQDVEQVLPEAVTRVVDSSSKDGTEILTLSNSALTALLVGAVKELSEKVKELEHGST